MGSPPLLVADTAAGGVCPICGATDCKPAPTVPWPEQYPFLPGGFDPMADRDPIPAPHRIIDGDRIVYGTGEPVPYDDAVKYGIAPAAKPAKKAAKKQGARARRPAEDRARKPAANR